MFSRLSGTKYSLRKGSVVFKLSANWRIVNKRRCANGRIRTCDPTLMKRLLCP